MARANHVIEEEKKEEDEEDEDDHSTSEDEDKLACEKLEHRARQDNIAQMIQFFKSKYKEAVTQFTQKSIQESKFESMVSVISNLTKTGTQKGQSRDT